jgi:hypothetical protein
MDCIEYREVIDQVRFFFSLVNPILVFMISLRFLQMFFEVLRECTDLPEKLKPEESIARDMKELVKIMKRK